MKKILLTGLAFLPAISIAAEPIHTWHTIYSQNGEWHGTLAPANEHPYFVDVSGNTISEFDISTQKSQIYGFGFKEGDDFNVAYTLTLTKKEGNALFSGKACVFYITADGPAQPDIRAESYYGATCKWVVNEGDGEDFYVY